MWVRFCTKLVRYVSKKIWYLDWADNANVHTRDLNPAILLSDAISIENFPSFQIATAGDGDSDNMYKKRLFPG